MLQTATTVTLTPYVIILPAPLHVHAVLDILVMVIRVQVRNIIIISINNLRNLNCLRNDLPFNIRTAKNITVFKKLFKAHLMSDTFSKV